MVTSRKFAPHVAATAARGAPKFLFLLFRFLSLKGKKSDFYAERIIRRSLCKEEKRKETKMKNSIKMNLFHLQLYYIKNFFKCQEFFLKKGACVLASVPKCQPSESYSVQDFDHDAVGVSFKVNDFGPEVVLLEEANCFRVEHSNSSIAFIHLSSPFLLMIIVYHKLKQLSISFLN